MGPDNRAKLGLPHICRDDSEETTSYIWIKTSVLFWEGCCRLLFSSRHSYRLRVPLYLCIIRDH